MSFVRYTAALNRLYQTLDLLTENGTFDNKKVFMFGSSKTACMIIYYLKHKKNVCFDSIIDNDKKRKGLDLLNLKIYPPEEKLLPFRDNSVILIASSYQDEMISQLNSMGYKYNRHIFKAIDLPVELEDYSFADRNGYTEMSNAEIRNGQIGALKFLDKICRENNIRYFISSGTLLGAVRHKGYIPWDDDIDVILVIKDLKKLVDAVEKSDSNYSILSIANDDTCYYDEGAILYDKTTVCDINHFPLQLTAGVYIDIFPLIGLPDSESEINSYVQEVKDAEMNMVNTLYDEEECNKAKIKLFELMQKYDYDKSNRAGHILGSYFMSESGPKQWFGRAIQMQFEDGFYNAPREYDKYLTSVYGDYMQLPPVEKRVGHHYFKAYQNTKI